MDWKKFLSRKFLLPAAVIVAGIVQNVFPDVAQVIDWRIVATALGYVLGEAACDIFSMYISWTQPKQK